MSKKQVFSEAYKKIPSVDLILEKYKNDMNAAPYSVYLNAIRSVLNDVRLEIQQGIDVINITDYVFDKAFNKIQSLSTFNLRQVINGTGIILHTGLGRAPLAQNLVEKALKNVMQYSNLELDVLSGKRGERNNHIESLLTALTRTESALLVNNNAAAVLVMLNSLAEKKEVIISRGEQVEIGGTFRIPDVIYKSGCIMVEVGTTNKTHLKDYENAINSNTGAILVAHTSNYKVMGFTKSVELSELSILAKKKKIPLLLDLGCGVIADLKKMNIPYELTVQSYVRSGADVVAFSGDKLLGGPQAGILCGKKKIIKKVHANPLYRALRSDKFTFSIMESILRTYLTPVDIKSDNLTLYLIKREQENLLKIGNKIIKKMNRKSVQSYGVTVELTEVEAGSGSLPLKKIPSVALQFNSKVKAKELSRRFRMAINPVIGYIKNNKFYIDLKAIPPNQEKQLLESLKTILL